MGLIKASFHRNPKYSKHMTNYCCPKGINPGCIIFVLQAATEQSVDSKAFNDSNFQSEGGFFQFITHRLCGSSNVCCPCPLSFL